MNAHSTKSEENAVRFGKVILTHPDKELYPELHLTKKMLAEYYSAVERFMLPYVQQRPLSLLRCPKNRGLCFFQKHIAEADSLGIPTLKIRSKDGTSTRYPYIDSLGTIIALTQLNTLEFHVWNTKTTHLEKPDQIVIDLDPGPEVSEKTVINAALLVRDMFKESSLQSFIRVTGGKGLHVVTPFTPEKSWDEVKSFAKMISILLEQHEPHRFISKSSKKERTGKIFVDYLRNDRSATAIANYSLRAREDALAAVPLSWDELKGESRFPRFSIKEVIARIKRKRTDPWKEFYSLSQELPSIT